MPRHEDKDGSGIADWAEQHPWEDRELSSQRFQSHAVSASSVLRQYGLVLADELIQAAQLEGAEIAVAATLMAGESNARNVWGHDPVETGGAYTKGGPVTRENYLAYRALVRTGRIGRQGCGPAQCTSAGYQDSADALGGCWDPVANMRAGLRGLQQLIRRYGVQGGAQRYNGSGALAVAYGRNFVARYQTWSNRLFGTVVAPTPPSTPTEDDEMFQDKYPLTSADFDIWDVACQSMAYDGRRIFLSITLYAGTVSGWIDFQSDKGGTLTRQQYNLTVGGDNLSPRYVIEVPDGTTKARIGWDATKAIKASLTVTGGKP